MRETGKSPQDRSQRARWPILAGIIVAVVLLCLLVGSGTWASPAQVDPRKTITSNDVTVHVGLQGRPAAPAATWVISVEVKVYSVLTPTTPYSTVMRTTDQYGNFDLSGIGVGLNNITVKGIHTLRLLKSDIDVAASGPTNIDMGTLLEGDANNDNKVNAADAAILGTAYWGMRPSAPYDARADFNNNGRIDARDSSLMATNYWLTGAN
jgi:hypothetical protein